MRPPKTYQLLCAFWGFSQSQERLLWSVLARTSGVAATAFRQHLLFYNEHRSTLPDAQHMLHQVCRPAHVLQVLELLWEEGLLSRRQTTQMEELVLTAVDRAGPWCDHQRPVRAHRAR